MSMLQGKFGLSPINNKLNIPPLVQMQSADYCKCSVGYHTVWTNWLHGQEPTCSCEPDSPTSNTSAINCNKLIAPKGYRYYATDKGCILGVDYEVNDEQITPKNTGIFYTSPISNGVTNWVKNLSTNQKLLIGAAVLGVGYFALSGGLSAESRTITSVTRFVPRKRNPSRKRKITRKKRR